MSISIFTRIYTYLRCLTSVQLSDAPTRQHPGTFFSISEPKSFTGARYAQLNLKLILAILIASFLTTACNRGSSASPPTSGISVLPGESRATVTWNAVPGVEYWIFYAPANSISTSNWNSLPYSNAIVKAVSPQVIPGLVNGVTYSFTLNGRTNGGPGGEGTPSVSIVPRIAGSIWNAGNTIGSNTVSIDWIVVVSATISAFVGSYFGAKILKKITVEFIRYIVSVLLLLIGLLMIAGIL